jgi:hypothetical protein
MSKSKTSNWEKHQQPGERDPHENPVSVKYPLQSQTSSSSRQSSYIAKKKVTEKSSDSEQMHEHAFHQGKPNFQK